jgi:hypothetical protein
MDIYQDNFVSSVTEEFKAKVFFLFGGFVNFSARLPTISPFYFVNIDF